MSVPDLTSHQQQGHTETGPQFKVSSERPERGGGWGGVGGGGGGGGGVGIDLVTPESVV